MPENKNNEGLPEKTQEPQPRTQTSPAPKTHGLAFREIQEIHSGPLPPPQDFAEYEQTLPGVADRILSMAEKQAGHRQALENKAMNVEGLNSLLRIIVWRFDWTYRGCGRNLRHP